MASNQIIAFARIFVSWCCCAVFLVREATSFNLSVSADASECFIEHLQKNQTLQLDYQVLTGGALDINVEVFGPKQQSIYKKERQTQDSIKVRAERKGKFKFCFQCPDADGERTVGFYASLSESHDTEQEESAGELNSVLDDLSSVIKSIHHGQSQMRSRQRIHRESKLRMN
eukprot:TRINITY_DN9231_c0_g1_i1.p1 TRINITY_DN9231_c0_g1~~TRINITY_DN9231_c0_g1_i1.p1  ORF type:complete len:172 (-),score=26.31 TRINITY_DN9231_c0_g1_i1:168-683(-)